jgi:Xaa-Pro dipeptidase
MEFIKKLNEVRQALTEQNLDGWLMYDFRGSNPLACSFLEIPSGVFLTRRFFYWIPQEGDPVKIVSFIEPHALDHLPGLKLLYQTWEEMEVTLFSVISGRAKIAMEYSPYNSIPVVSRVDAGTVELVRKGGAEVYSSAHLLQKYTSVLSLPQLDSHLAAASILDEVVGLTWEFIKKALRLNEAIYEYQVQQFMMDEMFKRGCVTDHPPICAVNANSADPHYSPEADQPTTIRPGDFILLDLWCRQNHPGSVYADIARVGVASPEPTTLQQTVFEIVKGARQKAVDFIASRYEKGKSIQGWEVDRVCRDWITASGYGEFFIHRTGHNIGEEVHGPGANLDDFETHDFRLLLPGTCFSIEPGIYLPGQFGVRLEYDVYLHLDGKVMVTGGVQEEIVRL